MDPATPAQAFSEGMAVLVSTMWPLFATLLVSGTLMGIIQAATQINDTAVGFVPRLVTGLTIVYFLGGWMVDRLAGFLTSMLQRMGGMGA